MHGIEGLTSRYDVLTRDDLRFIAGRYDRAEDLAEKLVDPRSPHAEAARAAIADLYATWDRDGTRGYDGEIPPAFTTASALARHIAEAIGATDHRRATEPDWSAWVMTSPEGYILSTPVGKVFLDATVLYDRKAVWMSQILCEVQGEGLGSRVMDAIHDHAVENDLDLVVFKVTNTAFFDRFEWLHDQGGMSYGLQRPAPRPTFSP